MDNKKIAKVSDDLIKTFAVKTKSAEDVSRATGVDLEYIYPCTMADISAAIRHRRHIDTVIHGRLVEVEP